MALGSQSGSMNEHAFWESRRKDAAATNMLGDKQRAEHSPGPRMLGDKDGVPAVGGLGMRHKLEACGANSKATEEQCGAGCTCGGRSQNTGWARTGPSPGLGLRQANVNVCRERLLCKGRRRGGAQCILGTPTARHCYRQEAKLRQNVDRGSGSGQMGLVVRPHGWAVSGPGRERETER